MTAQIINFEERSGWIKDAHAARLAAETNVGPTSNKINDHDIDGDYCGEMDQAYYPDPPLTEYVASAGYSKDDGEAIS